MAIQNCFVDRDVNIQGFGSRVIRETTHIQDLGGNLSVFMLDNTTLIFYYDYRLSS